AGDATFHGAAQASPSSRPEPVMAKTPATTKVKSASTPTSRVYHSSKSSMSTSPTASALSISTTRPPRGWPGGVAGVRDEDGGGEPAERVAGAPGDRRCAGIAPRDR